MADGTVTVEIKGDDSNYKKTVQNLGSTTKSALSGAASEAGGLSGKLSACAVAAGTFVGNLASSAFSAATGALKDFAAGVVETGKSFEYSMSNVAALSGATGEELENLTQVARDYGATTVFSASEAADALGYMALAGWDSQQSIEGLPGVLDLAAASGMGLAAASDMVTDYLSAFGMEAKDSTYFADMLAYAQANSNTTAEALGEAYKNCAANLHAAGQDVETVTSLLAMMANQGLKGSEAGTALAAIMRDITNSMEDGAIQIGETSVAVTDADGNFRDLTDIIKDVEAATDGMGDAQRAAALAETFTSDSTKGLNLILNAGVDSAAEFEDGLRGCTGAAGEMSKVMNDNLQGDMAELESAFEELQLKCYDAVQPALRDLAQTVAGDLIPGIEDMIFGAEEAVPVYDELGNQIDTTSQRSGGLVDVFGDIAGAAQEGAGKVQEYFGGIWDECGPYVEQIAGAIQDVSGEIRDNLGDALEGISPVVESVGGFFQDYLATGIEMAANMAGSAFDAFADISDIFEDITGAVGPGLVEFFNGMDLTPAYDMVEGLNESLGEGLRGVIDGLTQNVLPALGDAFDDLGADTDSFQGLFSEACWAIYKAGDEAFNGLGDIFYNLSPAIGSVAGFVQDVLVEAFESASPVIETLKDTFGQVVDVFVNLSEEVGPGLQEFFDGFDISPFSDMIDRICKSFEDNLGPVFESIKDNVLPALGSAFDSLGGHVEDANGFFEQLCESVGNIIDTVFVTFGDVAETAFAVLGDAIQLVVDVLNGDWGAAWEDARSIFSDFADGVGQLTEDLFGVNLTEAISEFCSNAGQWLGETWDDIKTKASDMATNLGETWEGVKTTASETWENVKTTASEAWTNISTTVSETATGLGETIDGFVSDVQNQFDTWGIDVDVQGIWNNLKGFIEDPIGTLTSGIQTFISEVKSKFSSWGIDLNVNTVWTALKGFITNPIGTLKTGISNFISTVKGWFTNWGVDLAASNVFSKVKSAITTPIDTAKGLVSDAMGTIQSIIGGLDLSLPSIALPHFHVSGGSFPWGIGGQGSAPTFSVEWYARGGYADTPSLLGFGEAGGEGIVPLEGRHMYPLADAVAERLIDALGDATVNWGALGQPWEAAAAAIAGAAGAAGAGGGGTVVYSCGDVIVRAEDAMQAQSFVGFIEEAMREARMYGRA